jgi:type III secretory pathway component EscV
MTENNKAPVSETKPPVSSMTPTQTPITTAPVKKSSNTAIIVIVVILVIIGLCCGLPFLAMSYFTNVISDESIRNSIQNSIRESEKSIEQELSKQSNKDIDLDFNLNTSKTQPLPSEFPQEVKSIIPASWKNPYNVNKSVGETTQYSALYLITGVNQNTAANESEKNLKNQKWTTQVTTNEETSSTIVTGIKTINGKEFTVNITAIPQGDNTAITLVVNY